MFRLVFVFKDLDASEPAGGKPLIRIWLGRRIGDKFA
jgi:hypothetical protein